MFIYFFLIFLLFFLIILVYYVLPIFISKKIFSLDFSKKIYFLIILWILSFSVFTGSLIYLLLEGNILNGILIFVVIFSGVLFFTLSFFVKKKLKISWFKYFLFSLSLILVIILLDSGVSYTIKQFYQPFISHGKSMYPSYYDKELFLIKKTKNLVRGDVVVFNNSGKMKRYSLKRIIGIPGDEIKIENGEVYLKKKGKNSFEKLEEKFLDYNNKGKTYIGNDKTLKIYKLGKGQYFVMGDNRLHSTDSRNCFGVCNENKDEYLIKKEIIGKVVLDLGYFNINKMDFIHPDLGIKTEPRYFDIP